MAAAKKAPVAVKPKTPPKPKFGEVGYEFKVTAKIVEVYPEEDEYNFPFRVTIDLGEFEDYDDEGHGKLVFSYPTKQDLLNVVSKTVPALSKAMKLDELNKAKAEVVRLTKELEAIK